MLLNALKYVLFRHVVIYSFSKYLECFLGPRSVLDTRVTTVYKRGAPVLLVEIFFGRQKLDSKHTAMLYISMLVFSIKKIR